MYPRKLTLDGFMSFRYETTIEFDGLNFTVMTGENGAGKSSVILGLSWVIYGENRIGNDKDSVVNDHEEVTTGILDLEDSSGTLWRIQRIRNWRSSTELTIAHFDEDKAEWITFGDHRISTAQDKIYEIVGLDEDAYYSLMTMKQSSMSAGTRFTAADSNQRRAILMGLLPELNIWGNFEGSAAELLYDTNQEITSLEHSSNSDTERAESTEDSVSALVDRISSEIFEQSPPDKEDPLKDRVKKTYDLIVKSQIEKDIENLDERAESYRSTISSSDNGRGDLETQLKTLQAERRAHNAEVRQEQASLESEIKERELAERSVEQAKNTLKKSRENHENLLDEQEEFPERITTTAGEIASWQEDLERLETSANEAKEELDKLLASQSEVERQIEALKLQVDAEDGSAECIVCQSPLAHEKAEEILEHSNTKHDDLDESISKARKDHRRVDQKRKDKAQDIKDAEKELANLKADLRDIEQESKRAINDIDENKASLAEAKEALKKLDSVKTIQEQLDKIQLWEESEKEAQLSEQIEELDDEHPLKPELDKVTKQIKEYRDKLASLNRMHGRLESEWDQAKKLREGLDEIYTQLNEKRDYKSYLEWVKHGCSPKGVPSMLIAEVLEAIEDRQNQLLERLMGDRAMQVKFSQERELKSREGSKSVLDIIVETPDGFERPIESFSGGEQIRLTFSNLFAMLQVFNERHPEMVETLFLDEPLGAIDRESVPVMVDIIRDALDQGIVRSVFIVAHEQQVIDAIPQRIEFYREPSIDNASAFEVI